MFRGRAYNFILLTLCHFFFFFFATSEIIVLFGVYLFHVKLYGLYITRTVSITLHSINKRKFQFRIHRNTISVDTPFFWVTLLSIFKFKCLTINGQLIWHIHDIIMIHWPLLVDYYQLIMVNVLFIVSSDAVMSEVSLIDHHRSVIGTVILRFLQQNYFFTTGFS